MNSHPHLRGEGGQRSEGPAGQNDAANLLPDQVLHAEARREAPVAENVAWKEEGKHQGQLTTVRAEHRQVNSWRITRVGGDS